MQPTDVFLFSDTISNAEDMKDSEIKTHVSRQSHIFARDYIARRLNVNRENIRILQQKNGKPYVDGKKICFNISHSGCVIAVAFSECEIGVDVEIVREYRPRIAQRYFTDDERKYIEACNDENECRYRFFEIWTAKEAFLKYCGIGLSGGFDFNTANINGMKKRIDSPKLGSAHLFSFREYIDNQNCIMALCVNCVESHVIRYNSKIFVV